MPVPVLASFALTINKVTDKVRKNPMKKIKYPEIPRSVNE